MTEQPPTEAEDRRYLQAGLTYVLLGAAVMFVTVSSPGLLQPERRADLVSLAVGLPIFLLVGGLIAYGDRFFGAVARAFRRPPERAEQIGRWWREKLVMLLSLTSLVRIFVFAANGAGYRPRFDGGLRMEEMAARPRMYFAALLMVVIVTYLVRASWIPWWRRRRGEAD